QRLLRPKRRRGIQAAGPSCQSPRVFREAADPSLSGLNRQRGLLAYAVGAEVGQRRHRAVRKSEGEPEGRLLARRQADRRRPLQDRKAPPERLGPHVEIICRAAKPKEHSREEESPRLPKLAGNAR